MVWGRKSASDPIATVGIGALLAPSTPPFDSPLALPLFDFTRGCLGRCTSGRGRYVPYKLSASLEAMLRTGNGVSRRFQERKHRINFIERANVRAQAFANRGVHNCPPDVKGRSGRHRRTTTTTTTTSSTSVEACQRAVMAWDAAEVCLPGQVCAVVIISILTVFPLLNLLLYPFLSPLEVVMVVVVVVVVCSLSLSANLSLPVSVSVSASASASAVGDHWRATYGRLDDVWPNGRLAQMRSSCAQGECRPASSNGDAEVDILAAIGLLMKVAYVDIQ